MLLNKIALCFLRPLFNCNAGYKENLSKITGLDRDEKRLRTRQWPAAMSVGSSARGSKWSQNGGKSPAGEKVKR